MNETGAGGRASAAETGKAPADLDELRREIIEIFVKEGPIDRNRLKPETTLQDLDLGSIDVVTVMMAVEDRFGVYFPMDSTVTEAKNFEEFINAVATHIAKERA
jgi:acyl carrier protein